MDYTSVLGEFLISERGSLLTSGEIRVRGWVSDDPELFDRIKSASSSRAVAYGRLAATAIGPEENDLISTLTLDLLLRVEMPRDLCIELRCDVPSSLSQEQLEELAAASGWSIEFVHERTLGVVDESAELRVPAIPDRDGAIARVASAQTRRT